MDEIDEKNAADYLVSRGFVRGPQPPAVEFLTGGVSNVVLRVAPADGAPEFVLKQVRERLRTVAEWRSRLERIWREVAALRILGAILPAGAVPRVLFEDRDNFLFAMTAAPRGHVVWKARLLAGAVDLPLARRLGGLLACVHRETRGGAGIPAEMFDKSLFDELRLDPYYRWVARRDARLAPALERLIAESEARADALTLGDFSPKNILLCGPAAVVVDFETAHVGDPAFDLGFCLTHLLLKSLHVASARPQLLEACQNFWDGYQAGEPSRTVAENAALEARAMRHLAACLVARIDGKSPVDYLNLKEQEWVRMFAARRVLTPVATFREFLDGFARELEDAAPSA